MKVGGTGAVKTLATGTRVMRSDLRPGKLMSWSSGTTDEVAEGIRPVGTALKCQLNRDGDGIAEAMSVPDPATIAFRYEPWRGYPIQIVKPMPGYES